VIKMAEPKVPFAPCGCGCGPKKPKEVKMPVLNKTGKEAPKEAK
jgi:hypothetical protein